MQEREFYEIVQQRGQTETVERAQVASEAVLETLGETLSAGEADDVATQLPSALGRELTGASHDPSGYDREAFVDRVGDRLLGTDLDQGDADEHVRAVTDAVAAALTDGERENLEAQLDEELVGLFDGASVDRDGA